MPFNQKLVVSLKRSLRGVGTLTLIFLLIEFFDELHYGASGAALPSLRTDLALSYAQVGLLLGLPGILNTFIEPAVLLLGDTRLRKWLVVGGGLIIAAGLVVIAGAGSFPLVLLAVVVIYPASGAFVSLAQATLMDLNPGREPHMMARWSVAGSLGNLAGPLLLAGGFAIGLGWRWAYAFLAILALVLALTVLPIHFPSRQRSTDHPTPGAAGGLSSLARGLWEALRNRRLLRWMVLLEASDLLLDIFTGYIPLYFTDVVSLSPAQVSLLLSLLMLCGLLSDILLIPLLERFPGRAVVRLSAGVVAALYAAWLLAPWLWAKIALVIVIKLTTLGWYQVLKGEAYAAAPGRSGTVGAISSVAGALSSGAAWFVGWVAAQLGLPVAMWLLLLGPLSLSLFVPPPASESPAESAHP